MPTSKLVEKNLTLLLSLYERDKVTLEELAHMGGVTERSANDIRNALIAERFLYEDGGEYRRGGFLKFYRVNHKRMDEFFVRESPLHHFYKRICRGHIGIIPIIKPDKEKMKEWMGV